MKNNNVHFHHLHNDVINNLQLRSFAFLIPISLNFITIFLDFEIYVGILCLTNDYAKQPFHQNREKRKKKNKVFTET